MDTTPSIVNPPTAPPPRIGLSPREAADALGISERTLWDWTRTRGVPHAKLGRRVLYPVRELETWLTEQAETGGQR